MPQSAALAAPAEPEARAAPVKAAARLDQTACQVAAALEAVRLEALSSATTR
jgi:hypothetical protein